VSIGIRTTRLVTAAAELARMLEAARSRGRQVGLVPTMGALHAGHRSLIDRARAECDLVVVSIFVNPLQFGEQADLEGYPRALEADRVLCEEAGVDLVFAPSVEEMYPSWPEPVRTTVCVTGVAEPWEGAARPGHFDGVATVVTKLFALAGRCRAYFGEKDFQQLVVVRRLVDDLCLPVTLVGCPTVREPDGLALSSRNARLGPAERQAATVLHRALAAGWAAVTSGERRPVAVADRMAAVVAAEPLARLDYAAVADPDDLSVPPVLEAGRPVRLLVAARVGGIRLIDNCVAEPAAEPAAVRQPSMAGVVGGGAIGEER
jgi:pantoate--beta-alanine ligase